MTSPNHKPPDELRVLPWVRQPATAYLVLGIVLGLGAPVGFLALRSLLARQPFRRAWRAEVSTQRSAYSYMTIATPVVFGIFGRVLGRHQEKLRRTYDDLDRLREEFAAVVAHDLRTPLATILLQLDILMKDAKDGAVMVPVETLRRLASGGRRLNEMIDDLLDAARIEAARVRLAPALVRLPAAVSALLDRLRPMLGDHPVELVAVGSPPAVSVDPTRLDQIVTNLVENAAKYSPESAPIRVEIRPEQGGVTLEVRDRGRGIPAEELPRLFDRFFQTRRARANKSGLGLGLYITKGLVQAHGGRIDVKSEPNLGSSFSVWLPAPR